MATMADVANIAQPEPVDLPGVPKGMDKEAEQMWNELTRMAKEDPKKYDKFVKGQMKDAERAHEAEQKSQPQPAICVERIITPLGISTAEAAARAHRPERGSPKFLGRRAAESSTRLPKCSA